MLANAYAVKAELTGCGVDDRASKSVVSSAMRCASEKPGATVIVPVTRFRHGLVRRAAGSTLHAGTRRARPHFESMV